MVIIIGIGMDIADENKSDSRENIEHGCHLILFYLMVGIGGGSKRKD